DISSAGDRVGRHAVAEDIRSVVLVLSASRGCSSLLFHLLRGTGRFLSLQGEHTHLYKLYGCGLPSDKDAHDGQADPTPAERAAFVRAFLDDCSAMDLERVDSAERYAVDFTCRLVQQW